MGYGYGFLLSLVKLPPNCEMIENPEMIENYAKEIAEACKILEHDSCFFLQFGVKCHGGSKSYGCSGNDILSQQFQRLADLFPGTIFAVYHFHWDYSQLTIYTFSNKGILRTDSFGLEELKVGPYTINSQFDFMDTGCPNNVTEFINEDYGGEFIWNDLDNAYLEN